MGGEQAKQKIIQILQKNEIKPLYKNKIECKLKNYDDFNEELEEQKEDLYSNSDDIYDYDDDYYDYGYDYLPSPFRDVKNIKKFPYIAVGFISVKFPVIDDEYIYTCFAVDTNVVITLASNIIDKNKGGKATSILTSFSDQKVKW